MELHKMQEILNMNDNVRHEIRKFYDEAILMIPDRQVVLELFRIMFIQKYYTILVPVKYTLNKKIN